jgi:GNAT superfamily N-acetyltransferase
MLIRQLAPPDAADFQHLRLRALRDVPDAFGSTYEEEVGTPVSAIATRLADGAAEDSSFVLGAVTVPEGTLIGLVACFRASAHKERHRATIGGMYVVPEERGRGVGAQLLDAAIARARQWTGLEQLTLTVVPESAPARSLYVSRGFRPIGIAPMALRDADRYFDVEHLWLPLADPPS